MKKLTSVLTAAALLAALAGCGSTAAPVQSASAAESTGSQAAASSQSESESTAPLPDGVYSARFTTDSSMFHVNELMVDCGVLTVENGQMSIYVTLAGTGILNLYPGTAEQAQQEGAVLLEPVTETVQYADGTSDEAYAFTIPVPCLDEEFDVALVGKKGTWYDHKVCVSDPVAVAGDAGSDASAQTLADGSYTVQVALEGGSGRASVESPTALTVSEGAMTATITWSSSHYDRMIVDGVEYAPEIRDDHSVFQIPVAALNTALAVQAETLAMSEPHMIDYTLTFTDAEAAQ